MPVLTATNIRHTFGQRILLEGISFSIEPGQRVGMVGRNGTGKSTLMKIMAGLVQAEGGTVALARGCRAGYLHQDPNLDQDETLRGEAESAFERLHGLHRELDRLFEKMATVDHGPGGADALDKMLQRQATLEREMEAAGGYVVDHKIDAVLHGLGFTDAQFGIKVSGLSGGQKGRVALAKLLLEQPDVLLLDEPTNHLDLDGRLWLEAFLKDEYRGAVVLISHDRYLLDNVVERIVEVEQGRLIDYPGNYEAFREIRAQRRLSQLRAFENEQDRFRKEEAYIRRYRAGQRAKQAQGRLSKLDRAKDESTLERPMEVETFKLELPKAPRSGDVVVVARGISKSYPAEDGTIKVLFDNIDVVISRGERWGIIGPNGAGKSTLVRVLLREQEPDAGTVKPGSNVVVGHYQQTHEHLPMDKQVFRYLQDVILKETGGQLMSEQQARNLAGAFLFSGAEQEKELGVLSGGERSRAVMAALLASAKNVLVLDEPTNHLDIPSAERLEDALARPDEEAGIDGYEGTLLLISHDRALIDATCDHLLVFDGNGRVSTFTGSYTEWHEREVAKKQAGMRAATVERDRRDAAESTRREAEERKAKAVQASTSRGPEAGRKNPLARLSVEELEKRIEKTQTRIKQIDEQMGDPQVWRNPARCNELGGERTRLAADLEPLEMEWMGRGQVG